MTNKNGCVQHKVQISYFFLGTDGFFPFGAANGDSVAPPVVDASLGPTQLDVPVLLFNSPETNVYVSSYTVHHD